MQITEIKIQEKEGKQLVNARELYDFLKIKTDFKDWFPRMCEYGFEEGKDFSSFLSGSTGGRPSKNFIISIDMAKEISMIQRSEKGKQARLYFIECEKKLKEIQVPKSYAEALLEAGKLALEIENKNKLIAEQKPKVLFAEAIETSKTSILVGELAKLIKQNGFDIGANRLFNWMREKEFLIKRQGSDYNMPTQKSMELELFEIKEGTRVSSDGSIQITKTPKVTGKGQIYFINKFINNVYV